MLATPKRQSRAKGQGERYNGRGDRGKSGNASWMGRTAAHQAIALVILLKDVIVTSRVQQLLIWFVQCGISTQRWRSRQPSPPPAIVVGAAGLA